MSSGPAFISGLVQEGDILCEVDGKSVLRYPSSQVSPHLLGPKDTTVVMIFLRGEERIAVELVRQQAASYARPETPGSGRPAYSLRQP